jgi:hypothetical protein
MVGLSMSPRAATRARTVAAMRALSAACAAVAGDIKTAMSEFSRAVNRA